MALDVSTTASKLIGDLQQLAGNDWSKISAFAVKQSKLLATQAQVITTGRVAGALRDDDDLFDFFVEQLERQAINFAKAVALLTILTVEKAWNLIVGTIWGAINKVLGEASMGIITLPNLPII